MLGLCELCVSQLQGPLTVTVLQAACLWQSGQAELARSCLQVWPGSWVGCVFKDSTGPTWDTQEGDPEGTGDFGVGRAEQAAGVAPGHPAGSGHLCTQHSQPVAGPALAAGRTLVLGRREAQDQEGFICPPRTG